MIDLPDEDGRPEVSLKNLRTLRKAGYAIDRFEVHVDGINVVFKNGESWVAHGLAIGEEGLRTKAFCEICAEEFGVDVVTDIEIAYRHFRAMSEAPGQTISLTVPEYEQFLDTESDE